ncbi:MAG: dioxygenase, partial [Thermoanaerobaculia bacterium]
MHISRRTALLLGGAPLVALAGGAVMVNRKVNPHTALAYELPRDAGVRREATPQCDDHEPTGSVTEGPFYKRDTPERSVLREAATVGAPLTLRGRVLTPDCRPVVGAVVDVWSCDGAGVYDNETFRLRGHQFTDAAGTFAFETVKPGDYKDFGIHRTPHVHVKVQGRGTRLLTTQLFFPGEALNEQDWFFDEKLLVR